MAKKTNELIDVSSERCRPAGTVLARHIGGTEARYGMRDSADIKALQAFLSDRVATEVTRVVDAENVVEGLSAVDAVAVHLSFSWG